MPLLINKTIYNKTALWIQYFWRSWLFKTYYFQKLLNIFKRLEELQEFEKIG